MGSGVGSHVLMYNGVDLGNLRLAVERLVKQGPGTDPSIKLPVTPRAKQVIKYAVEQAQGWKHNYVGTEHLLVGMLRERDGVAALVRAGFLAVTRQVGFQKDGRLLNSFRVGVPLGGVGTRGIASGCVVSYLPGECRRLRFRR